MPAHLILMIVLTVAGYGGEIRPRCKFSMPHPWVPAEGLHAQIAFRLPIRKWAPGADARRRSRS